MAKIKKESEKKEKAPKVKKAIVKAVKPKVAVRQAAKAKPKPVAKIKKSVAFKPKPALKKEKVTVLPPVEEKPKISPAVPKPEVTIVKPEVKVTPAKKPDVAHAVEVKVAPPKVIPPKPVPLKPVFPKVEAPKVPEPVIPPSAVELKEIELTLPVNVKDLAVKLQEKPSLIIKSLMDMGVMVGINQPLDEAAVSKLAQKYHFKIRQTPTEEETALQIHQGPDNPKDLKPRAPIVTIMGHVDHGKTSLLDAIRKTKVAEAEYGGITQHIGAYRVSLAHGEITFLDTPGHEAFTAMRSRGASVTDVVVLVVAADDGIMPQTVEAIDHARAAGVPIVVAINKMDKPAANPDRVKKQLAEHGLDPEDWGGKTITVGVSAKTGQGIDDLLEMMLLEAQMLELKANPNRQARGVVIEAKMAKGKGPVATLLVQNGTLHLNENIIVGKFYGKIRAMFDDRGHSVTSVGPGVPVEVLGISGIPEAGEQFFVVPDERQAKALAAAREESQRQQQIKTIKKISLEDLHAQIEEGKIKELKLIIKADVQGSLEAIRDTLNKLPVSEIKIEIIHSGIGNINSSDVILASASNALILGFNVTTDEPAKELVAKEGVDVKIYNIIYELANEIRAAIEGMLEPKLKRVFLGRADVRKVFKLSRAGTVAGCFVSKGKINRTASVSLVRNGEVVFEGKLSSLKRFKDDVREVQEGFECGITLAGFDQLIEGDCIEAYEIEKIARKL